MRYWLYISVIVILTLVGSVGVLSAVQDETFPTTPEWQIWGIRSNDMIEVQDRGLPEGWGGCGIGIQFTTDREWYENSNPDPDKYIKGLNVAMECATFDRLRDIINSYNPSEPPSR